MKRRTWADRPWISLNMAMTSDGKIATENRKVTSFGSKDDLAHLYALRTEADAVMSGARTVNEVNADLSSGGASFSTLRVKNGRARENLRVVVSGTASLDLSGRLFRTAGGPIVLLTTHRASKRRLRAAEAAGAIIHVSGKSTVNWTHALKWLRSRFHVKRLHCEGGADLNDSLFRGDWVDEVHLTVCPWVFGGQTAPTISEGIGMRKLADARQFRFRSIRQIGDELFVVLTR